MSTPDFAELLHRLSGANVAFVVVGGMAVGAWKQVPIETDLGRLDVIQGLEGIPPYEELRARALDVDVLGVTVPVCSIGDLKAMKRATGRTRDLADLDDLEAANG